LDESTEDMYILLLIRLNKLGLVVPVPMLWHGFLFLGGGSCGRRRGQAEEGSDIYDGFPDCAGTGCISEGYDLVRSGVLPTLDRGRFVFCPSLIFSGAAVGEDSCSGEEGRRYVYQLATKPGWFVSTTYVGGSAPLRGSSSSGVLGLAFLEASDPSRPGDAMASGHLLQPDRSVSTKHVFFDVLLKMAQKIFISSPGRWPASGCRLRSPVGRKTGRSLQRLDCNYCIFQRCLCNMSCNHQNYE
jgi:hypothetical protein